MVVKEKQAAAWLPQAQLLDTQPPASACSPLQMQRLRYEPTVPSVLQGPHRVVAREERECMGSHGIVCGLFPLLTGQEDGHKAALQLLHVVPRDEDDVEGSGTAQPLRLGVLFSGGQASGGHNVIIGLHDYLQRWHPGSTLVGFLNGPRGVMQKQYKTLTPEELDRYRNQGGFHLIASGRDKIEKPEQLAAAEQACTELGLDGLVVIGGDDSNTNAAVMAEHFLSRGVKTRVVGVPKTIDGDLKGPDVPTSFGFDTACKVYSELIGNIMIDALSAKKYYHVIKLMGRAASHITLECALQTHPQMALICEEVAAKKMGLKDVVHQVADMVAQRAEQGKNYGVVLIPEGLVEHVHDVSTLISEVNELLAHGANAANQEDVAAHLTPESAEVFNQLPMQIRCELLEERDPHGNVQVSHIETEKLMVRLVASELARRKAHGQYAGRFSALTHFFGYEGRCSLPSNFDATYCNALGQAAGALVAGGHTGVITTVFGVHRPASEWSVGAAPIVSLMQMERRSGRDKPVIKKALVEMDGAAMRTFAAARAAWAEGDEYRPVGPIQFEGKSADITNRTLELEHNEGRPILLSGTAETTNGGALALAAEE